MEKNLFGCFLILTTAYLFVFVDGEELLEASTWSETYWKLNLTGTPSATPSKNYWKVHISATPTTDRGVLGLRQPGTGLRRTTVPTVESHGTFSELDELMNDAMRVQCTDIFTSHVFVNYTGTGEITGEEINSLELGFKGIYNSLRFSIGTCDNLDRRITSVDISTSTGYFGPVQVDNSGPFITYRLSILGRCCGCESISNIFEDSSVDDDDDDNNGDGGDDDDDDDDDDNNDDNINKLSHAENIEISKAEGCVDRTPTQEEMQDAFDEYVKAKFQNPFVNVRRVVQVLQVEEVSCSPEVNNFDTNVEVNVDVNNRGVLREWEIMQLTNTFANIYNEMSNGMCDPLFRRITSISVPFGFISSNTNIQSLQFNVRGICRNCRADSLLFSHSCPRRLRSYKYTESMNEIMNLKSKIYDRNLTFQKRRNLQADKCFCVTDSFTQAPCEFEFEEEYESSVQRIFLPSVLRVRNVKEEDRTVTPSQISTRLPTIRQSAMPSMDPTSKPSNSHSASPSVSPSNTPTGKLTIARTMEPILSPTALPSIQRSFSPSKFSSLRPSDESTNVESPSPSLSLSVTPSFDPTGVIPSVTPSRIPSTNIPSITPSISLEPTVSRKPTRVPTDSLEPSPSPTKVPSISSVPTKMPSMTPSESQLPTGPSASPTLSNSPTESPGPSPSPTTTPTSETLRPTFLPTALPTITFNPSVDPSIKIPTGLPSGSNQFTAFPTGSPSGQSQFTALPTGTPSGSNQFTALPTESPSRRNQFTAIPTGSPSEGNQFTAVPTGSPSGSNQSTTLPTGSPSGINQFTAVPTGLPSGSNQFTAVPTGSPSESNQFTAVPTGSPSGSNQFTAVPTGTPSG